MATFEDIFRKIIEKNPQPEPEPLYWVESRPKCSACRDYEVMNYGDHCERCKAHDAQGWQPMEMLGRLANGFELDHGRRVHAVADGQNKAMCGAKPGKRSVGWSRSTSDEVTCPRCVKKLKKSNDEWMTCSKCGDSVLYSKRDLHVCEVQ